jgi:hypothetical protein
VSGLCYVHPHLGEECAKTDIKRVRVNLLQPGFEPALLDVTKELELSTTALREKFTELLKAENIDHKDIKRAGAMFSFYQGRWPSSCFLEVVTSENKKLEVAVDSAGKTAEVLRDHS